MIDPDPGRHIFDVPYQIRERRIGVGLAVGDASRSCSVRRVTTN